MHHLVVSPYSFSRPSSRDEKERDRFLFILSISTAASAVERRRETFISSRKARKTWCRHTASRRAAPTTNYFPLKRDNIFNLPRSTVWRNKVCMMSRNKSAYYKRFHYVVKKKKKKDSVRVRIRFEISIKKKIDHPELSITDSRIDKFLNTILCNQSYATRKGKWALSIDR